MSQGPRSWSRSCWGQSTREFSHPYPSYVGDPFPYSCEVLMVQSRHIGHQAWGSTSAGAQKRDLARQVLSSLGKITSLFTVLDRSDHGPTARSRECATMARRYQAELRDAEE